jgi:hypothetical protein
MNQIIGSFDKDFIIEQLSNKSLGLQAYSLYLINPLTYRVVKDVRKVKVFDEKDLESASKNESQNAFHGSYYILNIQKIDIKDNIIKTVFPTRICFKYIYMWSTGTKVFKDFSYSSLKENKEDNYILYNNKHLHAFINQDNKFYCDNKLNISTKPFTNSKPLDKGSVYEMNLKIRKLKRVE